MDSKGLSLVENIVELNNKIESIETKLLTKVDGIQEELKKKLDSEVVFEIDPEKIRGLPGEPGKSYVLGETDIEEIATMAMMDIDVPVVDRVIEKIEVIREVPIETESIIEVAVTDKAEVIRDKLETLKKDERLDKKAVKGLEDLLEKSVYERGLSIVDQRTSFLINKVGALQEQLNNNPGGGTPGGSDTEMQYNNGGVFGGTTGVTFDDSDGTVTMGGGLVITDTLTGGVATVIDTTVPLGNTTFAHRVHGYYTDVIHYDGEYKTNDASISNFIGILDTSGFTPTLSGKSVLSIGSSFKTIGSVNTSKLYGFTSSPFTHPSIAPYSGTADTWRAYNAELFWGSGTVTDAAMFNGDVFSIAGTVTNLYGLKLGNITGGANNWAIKTGTGLVAFGDDVTIDASPLSFVSGASTFVNLSSPSDNTFNIDAMTFNLGDAAVAANVVTNFNTSTNDGVLTWVRASNYFLFADDVVIPSGEFIYFGTGQTEAIRTTGSGTMALSTNTSYIFQVGGSQEASLAANALTFSNGATTTGLGWGTNGRLDSLVAGAVEVSVSANAMSFENGATDTGFGWATSGQLDFTVGGSKEMTLLANQLVFATASKSPTFDFTTDGFLTMSVGQLGQVAGASTTVARIGGSIFEHIADATVGGAETDIYTNTLTANIFGNNKEKIIAEYGGNFVTVGTELTQLKVYFAGTAIWDSTGLAPATGTTSWRVYVELIRVSSTVVRYTVSLNTTGATGYVYCTVGELTGLTLSGTNILKITGTSSGVGSGSGDIVGKMGYGTWFPAA